ncbi:hypothetical protein ACTVZO_39135 [Streptomyces sp. IBSNAI002]|uniref:hypothetical protein n=1 Tax=Streptomyces sp. IBSNAI002 TaxID=3457500 RepID=UPI003FD57CB8
MEKIDLTRPKSPLYLRADEALRDFVEACDAFAKAEKGIEENSKRMWKYSDESLNEEKFGDVAAHVRGISKALLGFADLARKEIEEALLLVGPMRPMISGDRIAHNFSIFSERERARLKVVRSAVIDSVRSSHVSLQGIRDTFKSGKVSLRGLVNDGAVSVKLLEADVCSFVKFIDSYDDFVGMMLECGADEKAINGRYASDVARKEADGKKLISDIESGLFGVQLAISEHALKALADAYVTVYGSAAMIRDAGNVGDEFAGCLPAYETRAASEILELFVNDSVVRALGYVNGQTLTGGIGNAGSVETFRAQWKGKTRLSQTERAGVYHWYQQGVAVLKNLEIACSFFSALLKNFESLGFIDSAHAPGPYSLKRDPAPIPFLVIQEIVQQEPALRTIVADLASSLRDIQEAVKKLEDLSG